jgi:hypothetical protein
MSDTWPPPPPPDDPWGGQRSFEAPEDSRFDPPSRWRRGHPIEPKSLIFSEIIERAFAFYRMHWRALIAFVAVLQVPLAFVQAYLLRDYGRGLYGIGTRGHATSYEAHISLILTAIDLLVVVPTLSVGTTRAVAWFHLGETPSAGQILQGAVVLLAPATVVVFLTSLSVLLGLLLLVIPGIYVLIRLQFAASALALDGQRGTYALRRSWQLVRGNFWRVLGITLLALLLGNLPRRSSRCPSSCQP